MYVTKYKYDEGRRVLFEGNLEAARKNVTCHSKPSVY